MMRRNVGAASSAGLGIKGVAWRYFEVNVCRCRAREREGGINVAGCDEPNVKFRQAAQARRRVARRIRVR